MTQVDAKSTAPLPEELRPLFWDCDFDSLTLDRFQSFVIGRILETTNWNATAWLRKTVGDEAIARWFMTTQGRGLDPGILRFWQLLLKLPDDKVDRWVEREENSVWGRRAVS